MVVAVRPSATRSTMAGMCHKQSLVADIQAGDPHCSQRLYQTRADQTVVLKVLAADSRGLRRNPEPKARARACSVVATEPKAKARPRPCFRGLALAPTRKTFSCG
jgi:hypothetical protein